LKFGGQKAIEIGSQNLISMKNEYGGVKNLNKFFLKGIKNDLN
jgi:hypothetical protein